MNHGKADPIVAWIPSARRTNAHGCTLVVIHRLRWVSALVLASPTLNCVDDDDTLPLDTTSAALSTSSSSDNTGELSTSSSHSSSADVTSDANSSEDAVDPRFEELAAAVKQELAANLATGASVAVWMDGKVTWVGGFGTADPTGNRAPDESTLFMLGSDTKKIASLSLLRKVAAGKITLETTIEQVLPDLKMELAPEFLQATVHQLLTHQSGIVDSIIDGSMTSDAELRGYAYGDFAQNYFSLTPPGLLYNYTNPNFSMAGLLDETVDGRPWADIVTNDIFKPLGMDRTFSRKSQLDSNVATGVGFEFSTDQEIGPVSLASTWEHAFIRPAGLVWSTPSDQMRLAAFLVDGNPEILEPTLAAEMHRAQVPRAIDYDAGSYGYGLMIDRGIKVADRWYDVPVWKHGGNTLTHTSVFLILPDQRFAVSILSNGLYDNFDHSLSAALSSLVDLPEPGIPPRYPDVDATKLDELVGTYQSYTLGDLEITRENQLLKVRMPVLDEAGATYKPWLDGVSTRMWRITIEGAKFDLNFVDGPDGATYAVSRLFSGMRPAPDQPAPLRRPITLADVERTLSRILAATVGPHATWK